VRKIGGREPDLAQATWRVRLQPEALAPVLRVRGGRFFSYESPAVTGASGGPRPRGAGPVIAVPGGTAAVITGLPEPAEGQKGLAQTIRKDPAV
jgi:hypothetical protein